MTNFPPLPKGKIQTVDADKNIVYSLTPAQAKKHTQECLNLVAKENAETVKKLADALDFYGRYLLKSKTTGDCYVLTPIDHDCGDRARAALALVPDWDKTPQDEAHEFLLQDSKVEELASEPPAEVEDDEVTRYVLSTVSQQLGVLPKTTSLDSSLVGDLGADSLDLLELVMAFEDDLTCEIVDAEAEKIKTVRDAVNVLRPHFEKKAAK